MVRGVEGKPRSKTDQGGYKCKKNELLEMRREVRGWRGRRRNEGIGD